MRFDFSHRWCKWYMLVEQSPDAIYRHYGSFRRLKLGYEEGGAYILSHAYIAHVVRRHVALYRRTFTDANKDLARLCERVMLKLPVQNRGQDIGAMDYLRQSPKICRSTSLFVLDGKIYHDDSIADFFAPYAPDRACHYCGGPAGAQGLPEWYWNIHDLEKYSCREPRCIALMPDIDRWRPRKTKALRPYLLSYIRSQNFRQEFLFHAQR